MWFCWRHASWIRPCRGKCRALLIKRLVSLLKYLNMSPIFFCLSVSNKQMRIRIANWLFQNGGRKTTPLNHERVSGLGLQLNCENPEVFENGARSLAEEKLISISISGAHRLRRRTHPPGSLEQVGVVSRKLLIDAGAAPFILQLAGAATPGLDRPALLISPKEEFRCRIMIQRSGFSRVSSFPGFSLAAF